MNAKTFFTDRPIAYHPILAKVCGSVTAALFLSQIAYWNDKGTDPNGWIYKTEAEMTDETGLSRSEQQTARKALVGLGVLQEERRGIPARMWYLINWDALDNKIAEYQQQVVENLQSGCRKPDNKSEENPQSIQRLPETTPKTTQTNKKPPANAFQAMPPEEKKAWSEVSDLLVAYSPSVLERFHELWDEHPDPRRHEYALKQTKEYANPVSWRYYEAVFLRYDPDKKPIPRGNGRASKPAVPAPAAAPYTFEEWKRDRAANGFAT